MNTDPVALPAEHIPPGTADWRSPDAQRWLAAVPAPWAHPLWAVLALVVTLVWGTVVAPEERCTSVDPCGADWLGLGVAVVLLLTLYWVWRQPRLALAGLGVVLVAGALDGELTTALEEPVSLLFLVAAAFTVAGLVHRLAVAARQRALALEAAGPARRGLPAAALTFRRGRLSFVLAALLLAAAGFGYWQAQQIVDAYEERAARLTPVSGKVTRSWEDDDGALLLRIEAGGRAYEVETGVPEDFPVDSTVDLLVDGDWVALAAEPYDILDWQLLVLAGSVGGLAFLANGVDGRSRSTRLRRGPLPVLRVLVREGHDDAATWVFAADDTAGERPILRFHSMYSFEDEDEEEEEGGDHRLRQDLREGLSEMAAILKGEDPPPPLREAVLYGVPYSGGEVAFLAREDEEDDDVTVECSVTAVRPAVPGLFTGKGARPEARPQRREPRRRPVEEVAAGMAPTVAPRVWAAHRGSRVVGLCMLAVQGLGIWAMLDDGPSWSWLWLPVALVWAVTIVSTLLNWRITADRDGLWVTGAWRVRHVPWDVITSVRHSEDGIRIGRAEDDAVDLAPTGWAWLERRLSGGLEPYAVRAADELRALLHRPELRPLEEAEPGQQGMALGPLLVGGSVLWGVAVLLLF